MIVGFVPSVTVTVILQVDVLPDASLAVNTIVVMPRLNTVADGTEPIPVPLVAPVRTQLNGTVLGAVVQLSVAVAVKAVALGAVQFIVPAAIAIVILAGQEITGGVLSITVIIAVQVLVFAGLAPSVTVNVTACGDVATFEQVKAV